MRDLCKYEFCSHPPALFDAYDLPLEAEKSLLADVLWNTIKEDQLQANEQVNHVLDGGALQNQIS